MKRAIIILVCIINSSVVFGQNIIGMWDGTLEVQGTRLPLIFNISTEDGELKATMDSPAQGAKGIPVTTITFNDRVLMLKIANAGIEYTGTLSGSNMAITGIFKQSGHQFPLDLSKGELTAGMIRPQEPSGPTDYYTEEVIFKNKQSAIELGGTLTLPQKTGRFPVVVLISGSGPHNRDGEMFDHKPFLVLSDYLAKMGIATLRYDDRGVGQSEGHFAGSTSMDFAQDVKSAMAFLKSREEIDSSKIGLLGHSEGGTVAAMVASNSDDVDFMVLLAAPGVRGDQLLLKQQENLATKSGLSEKDIQKSQEINRRVFKMVLKSKSHEALKAELQQYLSENIDTLPQGMSKEDYINIQLRNILNPWMLHFVKYDPSTALEKIRCPVMALNGGLDLQVSPDENLEAITRSLKKAGNKSAFIRKYDRLNHLFQECKTGLPNEYASIEQTFSPEVLADISEWIRTL